MKTYLDTGVLITAFRNKGLGGIRALQILDDSQRTFGSSIFVKLETLPKTIYNQQAIEREFYETFFDAVTDWANDVERIVEEAYRISCEYGLAAMDALHIAAAVTIGAEEFITTEKITKPMFRVSEIKVMPLISELEK